MFNSVTIALANPPAFFNHSTPISLGKTLLLSLPDDVLKLIGRLLYTQDAIHFTSTCVRLFNLRFASNGHGILRAQYWKRMPGPDEAISSIIQQGEMKNRSKGSPISIAAPGLTALTLRFKEKIAEEEHPLLIARVAAFQQLTALHIDFYSRAYPPLILQTLITTTPSLIKLTLPSLPGDSVNVICQFNQLTSLKLGIYSMEEFQIICQLRQLKSLLIRGYVLTRIPSEINNLNNLQKLNLHFNNLKTIPAEICRLSQLKSLKIMMGELNDLPADIGQLSKLEVFSLIATSGTITLSAKISQLSNLQNLYLQGTLSLPHEIGQLRYLQNLSLKGYFIDLPSEIGQLQRLRNLFIDSSHLIDLPAEIGQLKSLISNLNST